MPSAPTISNSSCLIGLHAAGYFDVLQQVYGTIEVPDAVAREFGVILPAWVHPQPVANQSLALSLRIQLGAGEAEAIALSLERSAARVILDDRKARAVARQFNLPVTGTLGVLLRAKDLGIVPKVRDALDALCAARFRISDALIQEGLRLAGE